jgi:hypothetical protein
MACALCRQQRELRNSHIIPEFMYGSLYDEIHRFHVLSVEPTKPNRFLQKGLRQPLLCGPCEQRVGTFERYVSLLMGGGLELEYETNRRQVLVRGVDYKAVRMFQLSILWRAGVSSLPFFSHVALGPHQETLRVLIDTDDSGTPWRYSCLMFTLIHEGRIQEDVIMQPAMIRVDSVSACRFVFGGHVWVYLVANHRTPSDRERFGVQPSGELTIYVTDLTSASFITGFAGVLAEQGKL